MTVAVRSLGGAYVPRMGYDRAGANDINGEYEDATLINPVFDGGIGTLDSITLTAVAAVTTAAESWIGPSATAGAYFKDSRLGFGTITPLALAHFQSAQGIDASLILGQTNVNRWHFTNPASATRLQIGDVSGEYLTILGSGFIGLGTTSPVAPLHVGPNPNTVLSNDPGVLISRDVSDANGPGSAHGFVDFPTITRSGAGTGYAAFDARQLYAGTSNYDHTVGLQSLPVFGSSGTLTNSYGVFHALVVNSGTVTNSYGVRVLDASGAGAVTNNYGLYVNNMTKGGTLNYAIYVAGTTLSYFGGAIEGTEITAPAAPAANGYRLYAEDDGAGKTRLMVRFATGDSQQIAIQP